MANKQGTVEYCGYKNVNTKKGTSQVWNIKLTDGTWIGCGFTKPVRPDGIKVLPGDMVRLQYEENQYGKNLVAGTLQVKPVAVPTEGDKSDEPRKAAPKRSFGGGGNKGGGNKDDYWAKKEQYDKTVTQPLIMRQAANNVAATLVTSALANGALPVAGSKKTDKFESYMQCFRQVRDEILADSVSTYSKLGGPDVSGILGLGNVEDEEDIGTDGEELAAMDDFSEKADDGGFDDDLAWD